MVELFHSDFHQDCNWGGGRGLIGVVKMNVPFKILAFIIAKIAIIEMGGEGWSKCSIHFDQDCNLGQNKKEQLTPSPLPNCNLGENEWNSSTTPPPPHFNDVKMAGFDQDCSTFNPVRSKWKSHLLNSGNNLRDKVRIIAFYTRCLRGEPAPCESIQLDDIHSCCDTKGV